MLDRTAADVNNPQTGHKAGKHWFWIVDEICPPQDKVSIGMIQRVVANHFGLKVHDLISEVRGKKEVGARHIGMYLARQLTKRSHPFIGREFNRHHKVSMVAQEKIEKLLVTSAKMARDIESIKRKLGEPI